MYYAIAADLLLVIHLGFVCFVVAGGLLVLKWRRFMLLHLPAVVWGALIEFQGWLCPLTPWEQQLRQAAGQTGYQGSFLGHYLLPVLYPAGLDRDMQLIFGSMVIAINAVVYGWLILRSRKPGRVHPFS
jgi:hypothetical protein